MTQWKKMNSLGKRSKKHRVRSEVETDKKIVCSFILWTTALCQALYQVFSRAKNQENYSLCPQILGWVYYLDSCLEHLLKSNLDNALVTRPVSFKRKSAYGSPCKNFSKCDLATVVPLVTSLLESLDFFVVV